MSTFVESIPWLATMGILLCASGFFSASEAALFYLSRRDRGAFETGGRAQKIAAALLNNPDRLLTAVLFWNLVINVAYFSLVSIFSLRLQDDGRNVLAGAYSVAALLAIILFGEMIPKSAAVLFTRFLARAVAVPLALAVRAVDPLVPAFQKINTVSLRLFLPKFSPEPYLQLQDLERAVIMSKDTELMKHEEQALQNILSLSELRVEEIMQPRMLVTTKPPLVSIDDLETVPPGNGYLLISEEETDEIAAAVPLAHMWEIPDSRLDRYAENVSYLPWSASAAAALNELRERDRRVIVVVNEHGESIGVLTYEDILDVVFGGAGGGRRAQLADRAAIHKVSDDVWQVTGMTRLRSLAKALEIEFGTEKSVTVAGILQDKLHRVPRLGDECRWHGWRFRVIEHPFRGQLTVSVVRDPHSKPGEGDG